MLVSVRSLVAYTTERIAVAIEILLIRESKFIDYKFEVAALYVPINSNSND